MTLKCCDRGVEEEMRKISKVVGFKKQFGISHSIRAISFLMI